MITRELKLKLKTKQKNQLNSVAVRTCDIASIILQPTPVNYCGDVNWNCREVHNEY